MTLKPSLKTIKADLSKLKEFEVIIYGSFCTSYFHQRSDIDIAVITRKNLPELNKKIWAELLGKAPDKYDVKIFELLPLEIKISAMKNYKVIFGDKLDISEHFYHFRKLWVDVAHRFYENQFSHFHEKAKALRASIAQES